MCVVKVEAFVTGRSLVQRSRTERVCVTVIRCNSNPLHIRVGSRDPTKTICSTFIHVSTLGDHLQEISVSVNY